MAKGYDYKGHKYWVTIEPAMHETTKQTVFIAFVNDQQPGGLLYGSSVKGPDGKIMIFETKYAALINANAVKQSEIDSKNNK